MNIRDPRYDEDPANEPPGADVLAGEYVLGISFEYRANREKYWGELVGAR